MDDGRTCEQVKPMSFGCAIGKHSYSSGIHRIRLKVHHGFAFLSIRTRITVPVSGEVAWSAYATSPSTDGWSSSGRSRRNRRNNEGGPIPVAKNGDGIALLLNCNEHRLSIVNEDGTDQDEMEVDHLYALFPWCLFVHVLRFGGRVSLL